METTVNKEGENYMKQMFKTCENTYKVFYHITFTEKCKSYKNCTKRFTCEERFLHEFKKNNNKCLFSYVYALRFTVKSFKYITCNGIIKLKQRQAALRALTHLTPRYLRKALYHQTICKTIKPSNYIKGNPKIIEIINS